MGTSHQVIMLNRGALMVIGAACALLFLIISMYNSKSLNSSLMAKLEETEEEVREAIDNGEDCAVKLDAKADELSDLQKEIENLGTEQERLVQENHDMKETIAETEERLVSVQDEKKELVESLAGFQEQIKMKETLLEQAKEKLKQLESNNDNLLDKLNEAENNHQEQAKENNNVEADREEEVKVEEKEEEQNNEEEGEEEKDDVDDEEKELEEGVADHVVTDEGDGKEYTEMPLDDQNNDDVLAKPEENNFIETSDNESIAENDLEAEEEKIEEEYDEDNRREESGFNMVYERSSSSAFEAGVDYNQKS